MTAKRLTISVPAELAQDLHTLKGRMNVSRVCSEALREEADKLLRLLRAERLLSAESVDWLAEQAQNGSTEAESILEELTS